MSEKNKVLVIGGGASGMMGAIIASRRGNKVTVMDGNEKIGKKIYATGNGKCNLTNLDTSPSKYRSSDQEFVKRALEKFSYRDTMKFFCEIGLEYKDRDGYIYPGSQQASCVPAALEDEAFNKKVEIQRGVKVENIRKVEEGFYVLENGKEHFFDKIILACGSKAGINEKTSEDIKGIDLIKWSGHKIIPIVPALTGIKCKNNMFFKKVSGARIEGKISLYIDGFLVEEDMGEIQITDYGISGIPAFQISRYASYGVYNKKSVRITCDFLPEMSSTDIFNKIKKITSENKYKSINNCFSGIINSKLIDGILQKVNIESGKKGYKVSDEDLKNIIDNIKNYKDTVVGTNKLSQSQVAAGGIDLAEIKDTMESKKVEGLYFAGEIMDVDGMCGGYNLQWAWTSGYIAGSHV